VYRKAGLGGSATRGRTPAVLVVDLQVGFTDPARPLGADCGGVIAATNRILAAARDVGAPCLFSVIGYKPGRTIAWFDKMPELATLRDGSDDVMLDPSLERSVGDIVVTKEAASAVFETPLIEALRSRDVDTVVVTGVTTSGCVRATVVDLVSSGFSVLVPRDAVGDRAIEPHVASLIDIQAKYGDVVSVGDVVTYFSSLNTPGDPR
jgi:nicotinamidase-related amidase